MPTPRKGATETPAAEKPAKNHYTLKPGETRHHGTQRVFDKNGKQIRGPGTRSSAETEETPSE